MQLPISVEPLQLQLNFRQTEKAVAKSAASLLASGDYAAIEFRRYEDFQTCHGCGAREKAKALVRVQERDTGETFEIGLQCMRDLYGVDVGLLTAHASAVAHTRRTLAQKLRLTGNLSTERQVSIVREATATYIPVPERHLRLLDGLDLWNVQPHEQDLIRDLYQLSCYHREWQEDPEHARRRWRALRGHPAFAYTPRHSQVQESCARALASGSQLMESEILVLNGLLRDAASFKHKMPRLAAPEDFPDLESYKQSLSHRLQERISEGSILDHRLTGDRDVRSVDPTAWVGLKAKALYAVAGVWQDEAEIFSQRLREVESYWNKVRCPLIVIGPVEFHTFPAVKGRRFNEKEDEWEDYEKEPAWTFHFRRVGWALVEPYTETYPLWQKFGRERLDVYA